MARARLGMCHYGAGMTLVENGYAEGDVTSSRKSKISAAAVT